MTEEPILLPAQTEPGVHTADIGAELPAPSREQECVSDGVFSPELNQLATVMLGLQAGGAILHHLAVETFPPGGDEEKARQQPPARPCC